MADCGRNYTLQEGCSSGQLMVTTAVEKQINKQQAFVKDERTEVNKIPTHGPM